MSGRSPSSDWVRAMRAISRRKPTEALAAARCALRLRALSRSRAGARRPEPARFRQSRGRRARRGGAASRRAAARRSPSFPAAIRAFSPWRRRSASRSKPGRRPGARSMLLLFPASPRCSRSRRESARRSATISARCRCRIISSHGTLIERRLDAAASAGFVIALYNPISRARPWQFGNAFERLRRHLPPTTPVVFGRAVGRPDEQVNVTTLDAADAAHADMATLVIVGSRETRVIARPGRPPLVYTPRAAAGSAHDQARRPHPRSLRRPAHRARGRRNMMTSTPSARAAAILP